LHIISGVGVGFGVGDVREIVRDRGGGGGGEEDRLLLTAR